MLEKDATKNTIFFDDDFTEVSFVVSETRTLKFEVHKLSTGNPAYVSELSKLCKIRLLPNMDLRANSKVFLTTKA